MKLMLRYLMRYKWLVLFNCLSVAGFALAELGIPTIISMMVDQGVAISDAASIYKGFRLILLVGVLGVIGTLAQAYFSNRISTHVMYDIRHDVFNHVMELSKQDVEQFGVSSLITRTGQDPYQIMIFLNTLLRSAITAPVMLATSIVLILQVSLPLSWIVLGTMPIIILGVYLVFKPAGKLSDAQQNSIDQINEILRENISGIRVVRAFSRQKYEEKRFEKENRFYMRTSEKLFKLMMVSEPMFFFLMNIASVLVYYFASLMIGRGSLQIGQLVAFSEYLFHCMMSILVFCMVFVMYPRADVSARRIEKVLQTQPSISSVPSVSSVSPTASSPAPAAGSMPHTDGAAFNFPETEGRSFPVSSLVFDHVSFVYPDGKGSVLDDISFEAKAGQKIAVIGATGSGKSSLAQLIERFYDPKSGAIYINGRNLKEIPLEELHGMVGYISQKAHIFTGTIRDNIAFGLPDATEEEVRHAAQTAQALEFIESREDGFASRIAEEGTNLSGGQKQRLSIARALIRKPGLYIFDDSFSALDFRTDYALRKALEPEVQDAILLIVAQRVSTILDADMILVLDKGKIAGMGTHQQLMASCPVYREIVLSQMSEKEAGL